MVVSKIVTLVLRGGSSAAPSSLANRISLRSHRHHPGAVVVFGAFVSPCPHECRTRSFAAWLVKSILITQVLLVVLLIFQVCMSLIASDSTRMGKCMRTTMSENVLNYYRNVGAENPCDPKQRAVHLAGLRSLSASCIALLDYTCVSGACFRTKSALVKS